MSDNNGYTPNFSAEDSEYFNQRLREELERAGHKDHVLREGSPEDKAKFAHESGDFSELKKSMPVRNEYLRLYGVDEFARQNGKFERDKRDAVRQAERERLLGEVRARNGHQVF
jgi:hypothetical protein